MIIDSDGDMIIHTQKYSLCEEYFGYSFKPRSSLWFSPHVIEVDKCDSLIKYCDFKDIEDNYTDEQIDSLLDRFLRLKAFL